MRDVARLSLSIPDDLMDDVRGFSEGDIKAFVTTALREAVDQKKARTRRHLGRLVRELEEEVGPVNETQVAMFAEMLAEAKAAQGPEDYDDEDDE